MSVNYEIGSIVWVRLGHKWWPGRVSSLDDCSIQYISNLKKEPLAVVRFFNESKFQDVTKPDHILPYNCTRRQDFIKKGLNAVKYETELKEKFEADVIMAEKLTGGNMDIIKELKEITKRRIDYSDLGFGTPKVKKHISDECVQRRGFSNIGEAIQYKRGASPVVTRVIEHKVKIMEQPKQKTMEDDMKSASNWFKCYVCGFTCGRLNVIIWHNKGHLKKVEDYDSGIRIPGKRRRRKTKISKNKSRDSVSKVKSSVNHSQTNGHVSPRQGSQEASQLLLDWQDDDQEEDEVKENVEEKPEEIQQEQPVVNGVSEELSEYDDSDNDYDDEYPPAVRGRRQPMPKQVDINSAFDALLAESSPLHRNHNESHNSSFANNDSDSESTDWEKYCDSETDESTSNEQESDIKSLCEEETQNGLYPETTKSSKLQGGPSKQGTPSVNSDLSNEAIPSPKCKSKSEEQNEKNDSVLLESSEQNYKEETSPKPLHIRESCSPQPPATSLKGTPEEVESPASPGPSVSKSASPIPERSREEHSEEHSTHSSNSSTSSGPAYMLVAVDAHGNNVPMPVLNEGGNHLVAVEASMEDGTTRTLYIDPAHLGPNVDLNNLMLHIDNSGQETVIIPTSTSDGETISSTLVDQSTNEDDVNSTGKSGGDAISVETEVIAERQMQDESSATDAKEVDRLSGDEDKVSKKKKEENGRRKSEEPVRERKEREREVTSGPDDASDDEELPDLEMDAPLHKMFTPNDVVWVRTDRFWWPAFVTGIFEEENKAEVQYINSEDLTCSRIEIARLKTFSDFDYTDIYESQENKGNDLKEAMEIANSYRTLHRADLIKEKAQDFFSLPISEQRSVISKQTLALRGVPIDLEVTSERFLHDQDDLDEFGIHSSRRMPEISEDVMSERDNMKLASAKKARKTSGEKFIRFIKSDACLDHLRKIFTEEVHSERHQYFKQNFRSPNYVMEVSAVHNSGLEFFGDDFLQESDILLFLYKEFENQEFSFEVEPFHRNLYINTVLFPEAIKESLRKLTKVPEEELESTLENGLYQTRTEQKARRLELI